MVWSPQQPRPDHTELLKGRKCLTWHRVPLFVQPTAYWTDVCQRGRGYRREWARYWQRNILLSVHANENSLTFVVRF